MPGPAASALRGRRRAGALLPVRRASRLQAGRGRRWEHVMSRVPVQLTSQDRAASVEPLLRTDGLSKHFKIGNALPQRTLHAVDDVSFSIGERQIVALAGESGSGKSTIARLLARILRPTSGDIFFEGKRISSIRSRRERLRYSGLAPMVFQDPFASLNPVFRVSHGVMRALKWHRPELGARERFAHASRLSDVVA